MSSRRLSPLPRRRTLRTPAVALIALAVAALAGGCAAVPRGAYFPSPGDPDTLRVARTLYRAAVAAGDVPDRYSFAFVTTPVAAVHSDEDGTFYVTEGLLRQPARVIDAAVAQEVAHEVLGHAGTQRKLSLTISAGFTAVGMLMPGVGLVDFLANPLAVRAFSRRQTLDADQKAVAILRGMGHAAPRRALAEALQVLDTVSPRPKEELDGWLARHPPLQERLDALEPLEPGRATDAALASAPRVSR